MFFKKRYTRKRLISLLASGIVTPINITGGSDNLNHCGTTKEDLQVNALFTNNVNDAHYILARYKDTDVYEYSMDANPRIRVFKPGDWLSLL